MGWAYIQILFKPLRPIAFYFTWPALSNENANDLSAGGFFYTGDVLYKQKPLYYKLNTFSKRPLIKNAFVRGYKTTQSMSIALLL